MRRVLIVAGAIVALGLVAAGVTYAATRGSGSTSEPLTAAPTTGAVSSTTATGSTSPPSTSAKPTTTATTAPTSTTATPATSTTPTTVAANFANLYQADVSGVIRIDASTCSGSGVGSGFLIAPGLVATAAHVVDGAVSIGLTSGTVTTAGHVIGIDDATDVALIQATTAFTGHTFTLTTSDPPVGTAAGVIGYPEGGPPSYSQGTVSGLDRSIDVEGTIRTGLLQVDAAINPGDSGGPLLLADGTVAGVADAKNSSTAGIGYAVPAAEAAPLLAQWQATPAPPATPTCADPLGPSSSGGVQGDGGGQPDSTGILSALTTYFNAIDSGDYATAYAQLAPSEQAKQPEATFAAEEATTYTYNVTLQSIAVAGNADDTVDVSFTSLQAPSLGPNGDDCDHWTLAYSMVEANGVWLIQAADGQNGSTHQSC
jgi:serine protease Do